MVGRNRFGRAAILVLHQSGGEFVRSGQVFPLLDQFPFFSKNENMEEARAGGQIELLRDCAAEVGNSRNVAAGILRDFQFVVAALKPVSLGIEPMAHQGTKDRPSRLAVIFFEN